MHGKKTALLLAFVLLLLCTSCSVETVNHTILPSVSNFATTYTQKHEEEQPSPAPVSPTNVAHSSLEGILSFAGAKNIVEESTSLGNILLNRTQYTLFLGTDELSPAINLNLQYPQLSSMSDEKTECAINLTLTDIAFKVFGDSMTLINVQEALFAAQEGMEHSPSSTDLVAEMNYKIVSYISPYLSLHFTGYNIAGLGHMNASEYLVTINVNNGACIQLTSMIEMDELRTKILQGSYEVLSGGYSPGGWDGEEMAEPFFEAVIDGLNAETLQGWHKYFSSRWDSGQSTQHIEIQGKKNDYDEYDIFTSENFAFDSDNIFLRFLFEDSLDGYIILKIPKADLIS